MTLKGTTCMWLDLYSQSKLSEHLLPLTYILLTNFIHNPFDLHKIGKKSASNYSNMVADAWTFLQIYVTYSRAYIYKT